MRKWNPQQKDTLVILGHVGFLERPGWQMGPNSTLAGVAWHNDAARSPLCLILAIY